VINYKNDVDIERKYKFSKKVIEILIYVLIRESLKELLKYWRVYLKIINMVRL